MPLNYYNLDMITYVALLRGINVGGNAIINMARLKECTEELGLTQVTTYINSGNVIFKSTSGNSAKIEEQIHGAILKHFSLDVKVVVRNYQQMEQLINEVPKSWAGSKDFRYNVIFLTKAIDSAKILESLDPKPGIEELHYYPGVLFWSAKTSDLTKTSMLKINKMSIYKEMTIRNINTTRKIYEIMSNVNSLN
jgi:uncharacterized protein (DUF1697 family)